VIFEKKNLFGRRRQAIRNQLLQPPSMRQRGQANWPVLVALQALHLLGADGGHGRAPRAFFTEL
jgi:hypothetical protein